MYLDHPPNSPLVLFTAAHGGFSTRNVPLGGGAAVCEHLLAEWRRTRPFPVKLLGPGILGSEAPSGEDLVSFSERQYAAFSLRFEQALTREILQHPPESTVVLSNDISEGPDFRLLAERGYPVFTIYHVDVVDYISSIYLRGAISPRAAVRGFETLRRLMPRRALPSILRLIFEKQRASVRHSRGIVVPSERMREVLLSTYREAEASRIHVLGWGSWPAEADSGEAVPPAVEFGVPPDAFVLLTLSRISPEKGQDTLLEALVEWERDGGLPERPLWLFLCGAPAYMRGPGFERRLRMLAARLTKVRVVFPGYVSGARKQALFRLAHAYVFPSRHESYGLTLMEALRAGLPAICLDHHGARDILRPEFGELIPRRSAKAGLRDAIRRLMEDEDRRARMARAAREYAEARCFSDAARRLAATLAGAPALVRYTE